MPGQSPCDRVGRILIGLFVLTLPFINPWIHGDGVGYYALARAIIIQHDLRFERDWLEANPATRASLVRADGMIQPEEYTKTGHLDNHFSVGPAVLWTPFLVVTHVAILSLNGLGLHLSSDGFGLPYRMTGAFATALYGFVGLFLSFCMASKYFRADLAGLATIGIWFGSSLPVYQYLNPFWSHAHSVFAVAFFLWYWMRTRGNRNPGQWVVLGVLSGLMVDVYYPNGVFLLLPLLESVAAYVKFLRKDPNDWRNCRRLFLADLVFFVAFVVALLPTLLTRWIIYGSPWQVGAYASMEWQWRSPVLLQVLFSSDHGLVSWTPIVIPAVLGLHFLRRRDRELGNYLILVIIAFYYVIASYPMWDGISSFGNRFFISLTPVFIIGMASTLNEIYQVFRGGRRVFIGTCAAVALIIVWNLAFIFQWGVHLIPVRGPISWRTMAHNQFYVVPVKLLNTAEAFLFSRKRLLREIEQKDMQELRK
jgi:hypothetical protein